MKRRSNHEARTLRRLVELMGDPTTGELPSPGLLVPAPAGARGMWNRMQRDRGTSDDVSVSGTAMVPTRAGGTGFTRPEADQEFVYGEEVEPDITRSPLATPRRRSRSPGPIGFEPSSQGGPTARYLATIVLCGLTLIVAILHWNHAPDLAADQLGQLLSESRAFAEQRPLTDIGLVTTRYQPTVSVASQPPGFSLLASLAVMTGGDAISIMRAPTALALMALCFLVFAYVRRSDGYAMALAVAAWLATALLSQHALDTPLPDLFWGASAWAVFLTADASRTCAPGRTARLTILVVLALLFHRAALSLIPALAIAAVVRPERHRRSLALAAVLAAVTGALFVLFPRGQTWLSASLSRTPAQLATDVALNIRSMADAARAVYLAPFPWRWANMTWQALALSVTTLGALELVRRDRFRLAIIFAIGYVILRIPVASRAISDAWVLWPLQLQAFVYGARLIAHRGALPNTGGRRLMWAAGGAVLLLTAGTWRTLAAHRPPRLMQISPLHDITQQLQQRGSTRVAFFSPRMLTWETRLAAMPHFNASPDETVAELRKRQMTQVVLGDLNTGAPGAASMARAVAARPDAFRRIHENGAFSLYDVVYP